MILMAGFPYSSVISQMSASTVTIREVQGRRPSLNAPFLARARERNILASQDGVCPRLNKRGCDGGI